MGDTDLMTRVHRWRLAGLAPLALLFMDLPLRAQERPVYRCPGNLYTDQYTAREAADKGCKTLEGAPVTVMQAPPPRREPVRPSAAPASVARGAADVRIDPGEQRARDTDARRILEAELRKEEERLAQLTREAVPGAAEQAAAHRAAIGRKEADIAAIKREIAKLGGS